MSMSTGANILTHISLGKIGEDVTIRYLLKRGFRVVERNFRRKFGEIDIVTKAPDKTLVFVEVKTMVAEGELLPEDQYSASKRQKTERICRMYAGANPELVDAKKGWRMDLIAIQIPHLPRIQEGVGLTTIEKSCDIKHYKNV